MVSSGHLLAIPLICLLVPFEEPGKVILPGIYKVAVCGRVVNIGEFVDAYQKLIVTGTLKLTLSPLPS